MLTFEFFKEIYTVAGSEKFTVANEMFHLLFYILESNSVDKAIFRNFVNQNSRKIINLISSTVYTFNEKDEQYLVERESLVVSEPKIANQETHPEPRL